MPLQVKIADLMDSSGVGFGTSGARGLVSAMTDSVCYAYTRGFLLHLERSGELPRGDRRVALGGDLRPSTGRILRAAARAVADHRLEPVHCGRVPSPALALWGIREGIPSAMVTGSHIPDDRNGIKYNKPAGEILKADERGIRDQTVELPDIFDAAGMLRGPFELPPEDGRAAEAYVARWLDAFPRELLRGKRIGVYEHSSVGRGLLARIHSALGAEVVKLGLSDRFVPVDTEAIRPEDVELARKWAGEQRLDAIVSADGDADRPLVADERGRWLRGDVAGILVARYLGAETVVVPVSCNTALERCGWFRDVRRTRIGSPFVIEEMQRAVAGGSGKVVGYEANGGFLTATPFALERGTLEALPTRDAVIAHLGVLGLSARLRKPVSALAGELPPRATASDRLKSFPPERSRERIGALEAGGPAAIEAAFPGLGSVASIDRTDGLRIAFEGGEILHLRPSGNAPELRCYTEADGEARAAELNRRALSVLETWR